VIAVVSHGAVGGGGATVVVCGTVPFVCVVDCSTGGCATVDVVVDPIVVVGVLVLVVGDVVVEVGPVVGVVVVVSTVVVGVGVVPLPVVAVLLAVVLVVGSAPALVSATASPAPRISSRTDPRIDSDVRLLFTWLPS
jgi:hypothetical protein